MAFKPTVEQERAINESGSIIVSAAAGSGKTAVLVERVIRMITNSVNPVMADKLLVVTYTNAAAAELRYRIEKRLSEEIDANPANLFLQKQKILLGNAKICTIDSFCINFIRENFEVSGVNPSFKIADRSLITAIEASAMSSVINEHFEAEDKGFIALLDFLGDDYDDSKLRECIDTIFSFSRIIPYPEIWLKGIVEVYRNHADGSSQVWFEDTCRFVEDLAADTALLYKQALGYLELNAEGFDKYGAGLEYYEQVAEDIMMLCRDKNWDGVFDYLNALSPPKNGRMKSADKDEYFNKAMSLRVEGKKTLDKISSYISGKKSDICAEIGIILPHIEKLVALVNEYERRLNALFLEKDALTFYMCEQITLSMLTQISDDEIVLSDTAKEYIAQFDAILVDEYQDTNSLQDIIFKMLSDDGDKLFCVGDIKQSIYRFRGSNPLNFLKKKNHYLPFEKRGEKDGLRIDLGCNFRSRKEICEHINGVFKKIIYVKNSDFDYDGNEQLVAMAEYPSSEECKVENHFIDFISVSEQSEEQFKAKIYAEARVVADIVQKTVEKPPFLRDGDSLRKADFGDITILIRSMKDKGDIYIKALKDRGIPVCVAASEVIGSDEVNTLISILKVINNPSNDVALLTVLTSPIFAFSMDELAKIRVAHRHGNLIASVIAYAKNGDPKTRDFLALLDRLRYKNIVLPTGKLIDEVFDETNMLNVYSTFENGEVRRLNLLGVLNMANSFEKEGRKDLQSFINAFEQLENRDFSLSSSSGANSVTVMSIHKSKGLQFPICILANTSNRFNMSDVNSSCLVSEDRGFSCVYRDSNGDKKDRFILKNLMQLEEKRQLLAEELRIFYVALTRAEEKLITVSFFNNLTEEVEKKSSLLKISESNDRVDYSVFRKDTSYADWILESLLLDGYKKDILSGGNESFINVHTSATLPEPEISEEKVMPDLDRVEMLKKLYSYEYPFAQLLSLESKASVTDLVHKADADKFMFISRPAFMQEKGLSSAEKGTAIHKVMQYVDFEVCRNDLSAELERLYEHFYLNERELEMIETEYLESFFSSELCSRIITSNEVKREFKFLTEIPATELSDEIDKRFDNEKVIVQGAVDLLFVENESIVIVDFKTDRNKDEGELLKAYEEQLRMYARACEKQFGLRVSQLLIYSFSLNKQIEVKYPV